MSRRHGMERLAGQIGLPFEDVAGGAEPVGYVAGPMVSTAGAVTASVTGSKSLAGS